MALHSLWCWDDVMFSHTNNTFAGASMRMHAKVIDSELYGLHVECDYDFLASLDLGEVVSALATKNVPALYTK